MISAKDCRMVSSLRFCALVSPCQSGSPCHFLYLVSVTVCHFASILAITLPGGISVMPRTGEVIA